MNTTNAILTAILLGVTTNWFDKLPEPDGKEPEVKVRCQIVSTTYIVGVPGYGWVTNSVAKTNSTHLRKLKPTDER